MFVAFRVIGEDSRDAVFATEVQPLRYQLFPRSQEVSLLAFPFLVAPGVHALPLEFRADFQEMGGGSLVDGGCS